MIAEIVFKNYSKKKEENLVSLKRFCQKNLPKYKIPSKFIVKNLDRNRK